VALLPAYNEHLVRDFGGMNLAMAVVFGVAAVTLDRRLAATALVAYLVFAVPHLAFHAGATGALGRHLVPALVAAGHQVTAITRTPGKVAQMREAGAEPPLRLPAWLGRLLAGEFVVAQMTSWRGASNEKARKELGWEPRYASRREGFHAWVGG
jgi:nucleoside-diphosphate-sugar epimerase